MSSAAATFGPWLALVLIVAVMACALAAATTRSLVALCLALWASAGLAVAALLALGRGEGALAFAVLAAGLAPALLLAAVLLSARVVKAGRRRRAWASVVGALAVVGATLWGMPDIPVDAPRHAEDAMALFWLGPLLLVAGAAVIGVLGFGERGAFETFARTVDE